MAFTFFGAGFLPAALDFAFDAFFLDAMRKTPPLGGRSSTMPAGVTQRVFCHEILQEVRGQAKGCITPGALVQAPPPDVQFSHRCSLTTRTGFRDARRHVGFVVDEG